MKRSRGFTLIELMIVVAIIAILSSLSITIYMDSVSKAELSEAFTLADGMKTEIADYYTQTGSCPIPGTSGQPAAASYSGKYVGSVDIRTGGTGCVITAMMRSTSVSPKLQGKTVTLTMSGSTGGVLSWQCTSDADPKYIPQACH